MIGTDTNHLRIVKDSLNDVRAIDEQTFASISILEERLERLKRFDKMFSGVQFSTAVKKLTRRNVALTVG